MPSDAVRRRDPHPSPLINTTHPPTYPCTHNGSDGLEEELLTLVPAQCKEGGLAFARVLKVRVVWAGGGGTRCGCTGSLNFPQRVHILLTFIHSFIHDSIDTQHKDGDLAGTVAALLAMCRTQFRIQQARAFCAYIYIRKLYV